MPIIREDKLAPISTFLAFKSNFRSGKNYIEENKVQLGVGGPYEYPKNSPIRFKSREEHPFVGRRAGSISLVGAGAI